MVNTNTTEILHTNFEKRLIKTLLCLKKANININIYRLNENKVNIYVGALSYWNQCLIFVLH